jgi:hypothetical protein
VDLANERSWSKQIIEHERKQKQSTREGTPEE